MNNIINGLSPVTPQHEDYMEQALNPSFLQGKELSDEQETLLNALNTAIDKYSSSTDGIGEIASTIKDLLNHFPGLSEEIINYAVQRTHTIATDKLKLGIALKLVALYAPEEENKDDINKVQTQITDEVSHAIS